MKSYKYLLLALGLALGAGVNAFGQQTATNLPPVRPNLPAIDLSKLPPDIRALIVQFQSQRATLVETARALMASLQGATPDQRKAILDQFAADNRALLAGQRELARQIRTELRTLRQHRQTGG